MGDPETEVVLPRLETDLVSLFAAMDNGTLVDTNIEYNEGSFATVVAVSGGYPGNYEKNKVIVGLDATSNNSIVFHAGTKQQDDTTIVTNGGRVLTVTSSAETITQAVKNCKTTLAQISFEGMYFRNDIGFEFVREERR